MLLINKYSRDLRDVSDQQLQAHAEMWSMAVTEATKRLRALPYDIPHEDFLLHVEVLETAIINHRLRVRELYRRAESVEQKAYRLGILRATENDLNTLADLCKRRHQVEINNLSKDIDDG